MLTEEELKERAEDYILTPDNLFSTIVEVCDENETTAIDWPLEPLQEQVDMLVSISRSINEQRKVDQSDIVSLESFYGDTQAIPDKRRYTKAKSEQGLNEVLPLVSGEIYNEALESAIKSIVDNTTSVFPGAIKRFIKQQHLNVKRTTLGTDTKQSADALIKLGRFAKTLGGGEGETLSVDDIPKDEDGKPHVITGSILSELEGNYIDLVYDKVKFTLGSMLESDMGILGALVVGDVTALKLLKEFDTTFNKRKIELQRVFSAPVNQRNIDRIPRYDETTMAIITDVEDFKDDNGNIASILQDRSLWDVLERFEEALKLITVPPITEKELDKLNEQAESYLESLDKSHIGDTDEGKAIIAETAKNIMLGIRQLTAFMRITLTLQSKSTRAMWVIRTALYTARREMINVITHLREDFEDESKLKSIDKVILKAKSDVVEEHDSIHSLRREFKA